MRRGLGQWPFAHSEASERPYPEAIFGAALLKSWNVWRNRVTNGTLLVSLAESITLDPAETLQQGNPALQPRWGNDPTYFGGYPMLRSSGAGEWMQAAGNPLLTVPRPYTAIAIGMWEGLSGATEYIYDGATAGARGSVRHNAAGTLYQNGGADLIGGPITLLLPAVYYSYFDAGGASTFERYTRTGVRTTWGPGADGVLSLRGMTALSRYDNTSTGRARITDLMILAGAINVAAKTVFEAAYLRPMGWP